MLHAVRYPETHESWLHPCQCSQIGLEIMWGGTVRLSSLIHIQCVVTRQPRQLWQGRGPSRRTGAKQKAVGRREKHRSAGTPGCRGWASRRSKLRNGCPGIWLNARGWPAGTCCELCRCDALNMPSVTYLQRGQAAPSPQPWCQPGSLLRYRTPDTSQAACAHSNAAWRMSCCIATCLLQGLKAPVSALGMIQNLDLRDAGS